MPIVEKILNNPDFDHNQSAKELCKELIQTFDQIIPELCPKIPGERDSVFHICIDPQIAFFGEHINKTDLRLQNREPAIQNIAKLIKLLRANDLKTNITQHLCSKSAPGGLLSLEDTGRDPHPKIIEILQDSTNSGMVNIGPKTEYSAWREDWIRQMLYIIQPRYVVLSGGSTEVCVLETAIDIARSGFDVLTVADCVASTSPAMNLQILKLLNSRQYNQQVISLDQIQRSLLSNS
jgi:nicotinamidase-related amidase